MKTVFQTFLKSLLVGATFVIAIVVGGMIVTMLGLTRPEAENPTAKLMWFFVGGVIAGLSLGFVVHSIPASRTRHFVVWGSLILFNMASVIVEGYFFAPALIGGALPALLFQQLLVALAVGWVITMLFASRNPPRPSRL